MKLFTNSKLIRYDHVISRSVVVQAENCAMFGLYDPKHNAYSCRYASPWAGLKVAASIGSGKPQTQLELELELESGIEPGWSRS